MVERETRVARDLMSTLVRFGYHVPAMALSACEAVEAVDRHRPDLILMDLSLDTSDDGIAAAVAIHKRHPTPVVFLTEQSDGASLMRAQEEAQPHGYVLKPYEDRNLRAAVEIALRRHRFEQEILQQRTLLAGVLSGMSDAVAAADVDGNIVLVNDAGRVSFGEKATVASPSLGESGHRVYLPDQQTIFPAADLPLARALAGEAVRDVEIFVRSDREPAGHWYSVNAQPLRDAEGLVCGAVEVARDVTLLRAERSELQERSDTDPLTGAYNRRGFMQVARTAFDAAHHAGLQPALFFIDLNGMKRINDSLGHLEGDRLLMDVTWILRACFRTSDIVGRLGGDEFVVLAPDAGDHSDVLRERLRSTVEQFNEASERAYRISISVGLSTAEPGEALSLEELVERADKRMYEDKSVRAARRVSVVESTAPNPSSSAPASLSVQRRASHAYLAPPRLPSFTSPHAPRSTQVPTTPKKVLIVDDEPRNLVMLERLLAPLGHECIRAEDGQSAIAAFANHRPDLVLLDLVMPGLDGLDVLSYIRCDERDEHVPVIVLTAHSEREHKLRGLEQGADDFIEKPVDARSLRARATTLLQLKDSSDALRRLNAELESRNAELNRLQREQRELSTFILHDLKSPLASIWTDIDFARDQLGPNQPSAAEALAEADAACRRLRSMMDDLLIVSQLEEAILPLDDQHIVLTDLVHEVLSDHARRAAGRGVTLLAPPRCDLAVTADRALLRRVIDNLIDNSLRYTPAHGQIGVTIHEGSEIRIHVSNTGPAIPILHRERIFEKFARIEKQGIGRSAGLGLYFCKRVLTAMGGSIEVTETPEWPTLFVLHLPAIAA